MDQIFLEFKNRDTGLQEWIDIRHIYRVFPCPEPEHIGNALVWLDIIDVVSGKPLVILADLDAAEFMDLLNRTIYMASNERNPTRRNHGKQH